MREEWGEACSCFIDADEVVRLLRRVSEVLGIPSEHHNYADNVSVWIEDGNKLLDYLESRRFTPHNVAALIGLKAEALKPLIGNMKALSRKWRRAIGSRGELHFYVDAF
ncbi:MAG: hypothetical protein ACHP78_01640 [Terriglobales bacterium]